MRSIIWSALLVLFVGPAAAAEPPKKPSLEDDQKALQGAWELVPDKNPKGSNLRLEFMGKVLTITTKRGILNLRNTIGYALKEKDGKRYVSEWPYTLEGDTLTITMTAAFKGKWVLARKKK